ncbi:hypothetical protein SAMN04487928_11935 [Butyrivibrio proteoclasticus]|uniref:PglD N-terminal domain-containing protein n=2 Tax=Butyrivibrio proteoclasticus TaxID=43305 RepID=A0A1I5VV18_9FIRM|nr:hypothetical protein SAMN04487928_11935 [Butyrivibrio proteoclasticus]
MKVYNTRHIRRIFLCFFPVSVVFIISVVVIRKLLNYISKVNIDIEKKICYINLYNMWISQYIQQKKISDFVVKNGYKNIAIYGWGDLGKRLYDELIQNSEINLRYIVDRADIKEINSLCKCVKNANDINEKIDLLIITPFIEFDTIKDSINNDKIMQIFSLEDLVYEM